MSALLLKAEPVVAVIQEEIKGRVQRFLKAAGRPPCLVVVRVGSDPASVIYTTHKVRRAQELGLNSRLIELPEGAPASAALAEIQALNLDPAVDGILLQTPLPASYRNEEVVTWVSPEKDVDAFHPLLAGKLFLGLPGLQPCTPAGILRMLDHYGIPVARKRACVVGRSAIVGKPLATLLLQRDATVLHCHSKTEKLDEITRQADLLFVAAGRAALIRKQHVKPGAIVVDIGIHRSKDGKLQGDAFAPEVAEVASAYTPVPGGVGPLTIHQLFLNTLSAAEARVDARMPSV